MINHRIVRMAVTIAILLGVTACMHVPANTNTASYLCAENEILTYKPVDLDKTVITVGKYTFFNSDPLEAAIESKFPEVDVVTWEEAGATNLRAWAEIRGEHDELADILFSAFTIGDSEYFYDLSGESFTIRYNLHSLNDLSSEGKLNQLPVSSSVNGIFYNKTLFEEHGWKIPATLDEFYMLCDTIMAEGIRPFVPCLKYSLQEVGMGLSSRLVFSSSDKTVQYEKFVKGEASCKGLLEPYYETLKELYERGIIQEEDFSSSLTQNRYALYDGKIAMLPGNLDMYTLYEEEKPDCEIDFIGYFTDTPNERWMQMVPGRNMGLSQKAMEDPKKKQLLLDIFDFLSTNEGQAVLFECFTGISSVKSYQTTFKDEFWDIKNCMENGRIFFADSFGTVNDNATVKEWVMGVMTMDEILDATDQFPAWDALGPLQEEPFGTASQTFTILETSNYVADTMRKVTGADIALVLHSYYYKGNYAKIYQGDILMPNRFYLRGLSSEDALTTYEITGDSLKELMEHPIVNGEEINAMYAFSGLNMEYAPWYDMNHNVRKLTLEDGSEIDGEALYKVAAWATSIDESYISSTLRSYSELGGNVELMTSAIKQAGPISPTKDNRITLIWN